jgi:hypothetical protein
MTVAKFKPFMFSVYYVSAGTDIYMKCKGAPHKGNALQLTIGACYRSEMASEVILGISFTDI